MKSQSSKLEIEKADVVFKAIDANRSPCCNALVDMTQIGGDGLGPQVCVACRGVVAHDGHRLVDVLRPKNVRESVLSIRLSKQRGGRYLASLFFDVYPIAAAVSDASREALETAVSKFENWLAENPPPIQSLNEPIRTNLESLREVAANYDAGYAAL